MTDINDTGSRFHGGSTIPDRALDLIPSAVIPLPDPLQLSGQEQQVLAAVIAPIARRMALVAARKAQEAVCDEILRRLETEIGETFGMSKITGVANMVRAVRANPPTIGM